MQWPVDPNSTFQPGQIGQLGVIGNNIICGISDGSAPIGVIDDIKVKAFSAPAIDEDIIVPAVGKVGPDGKIVSVLEVQGLLENSNVIRSSFVSGPVSVELIPVNGVVVFPEGTELNFDLDGDGIPDAIRTVVSYAYQVPDIPGDDSTQASGMVTIWFQRMIAQTDMYETNQRYALGDNLFVSESGFLTSRQASQTHPGIAIVTGPPTATFTSLEFMWL